MEVVALIDTQVPATTESDADLGREVVQMGASFIAPGLPDGWAGHPEQDRLVAGGGQAGSLDERVELAGGGRCALVDPAGPDRSGDTGQAAAALRAEIDLAVAADGEVHATARSDRAEQWVGATDIDVDVVGQPDVV